MLLILALALSLLAPLAAQAASYATATVKGGWLRLRDGASTDAKTISAYFTGTTVKLLGGSGEWYHVLAPDGKTGYMHSSFLTITGSITGGQLEENTAATVRYQTVVTTLEEQNDLAEALAAVYLALGCLVLAFLITVPAHPRRSSAGVV